MQSEHRVNVWHNGISSFFRVVVFSSLFCSITLLVHNVYLVFLAVHKSGKPNLGFQIFPSVKRKLRFLSLNFPFNRLLAET